MQLWLLSMLLTWQEVLINSLSRSFWWLSDKGGVAVEEYIYINLYF